MASVFISCGEPSGDLYAGALVDQLRSLDPTLTATGLGGEKLQAAGATLVGDYRGLAVTGLVEALGVLPKSLATYRRLVRAAREHRPDVFVAIDFPDFNFRLAGAMRRLGIPVVYYIPPQLWAWRTGRMRTLSALASRILVIFPFEPEIYRAAGVPATFVGHPLVDLACASRPREAFLRGLGLDPTRPTLALLPGSRPNEVLQILPTLAKALPLIAARVPGVQFVLARAPRLADALFASLGSASARVTVVENLADEVLASADAVVTASGTATVQAAIHECPTDGDKDDIVTIPNRLVGNYMIRVVAEPGDSGAYDLGIRIDGSNVVALGTDEPSPPPGEVVTYTYNAPWFMRGDVNGDWTRNVSDVVYLINYLFLIPPGPAPEHLEAGDVNCDGMINVSDVVYLINYLFIGGPPPCS